MDFIILFQNSLPKGGVSQTSPLLFIFGVMIIFGLVFWRLGGSQILSLKKGRRLNTIGGIAFFILIISVGISYLRGHPKALGSFLETLMISLGAGIIIGGSILASKVFKEKNYISKHRFSVIRFFMWPIFGVGSILVTYAFLGNILRGVNSFGDALVKIFVAIIALFPILLGVMLVFALIVIPVSFLLFPELVPLQRAREELKYRNVSSEERDKDKEDAIEYFTKSIKVHPTATAFLERAEVEADLAKWEDSDKKTRFRQQAIEDYNTAIGMEPNNAKFYYLRGKAKGWFWEEGGYSITSEELLEDFNSALKFAKRRSFSKYEKWDIHRLIAITNEQMGNLERAVEYYDQAIKILSTKHYLYQRRGQIKVRIGKIQEGLDDTFYYMEKEGARASREQGFLFKIGKGNPEYQAVINNKMKTFGEKEFDFSQEV